MRKLFILILLSVAFLGGYRTGQSPNSPDVLGYANKAWTVAYSAGRNILAAACQAGTNIAAAEPDKN